MHYNIATQSIMILVSFIQVRRVFCAILFSTASAGLSAQVVDEPASSTKAAAEAIAGEGETGPPALAKGTSKQKADKNQPTALLQNPQVNAVVTAHLSALYLSRYTRFFERLKLPSTTRKSLIVFLVKRRLKNLETNLATPAENESETPAKTGAPEVDPGLSEILGPELAAEFDRFNRTIAARKTTDRLQRRLELTDAPLSPEQSEAMIDALYQAKQLGQRNNQVLTSLATILSAEQLSEYKQLLVEQKAAKEVENRHGPILPFFDISETPR